MLDRCGGEHAALYYQNELIPHFFGNFPQDFEKKIQISINGNFLENGLLKLNFNEILSGSSPSWYGSILILKTRGGSITYFYLLSLMWPRRGSIASRVLLVLP